MLGNTKARKEVRCGTIQLLARSFFPESLGLRPIPFIRKCSVADKKKAPAAAHPRGLPRVGQVGARCLFRVRGFPCRHLKENSKGFCRWSSKRRAAIPIPRASTRASSLQVAAAAAAGPHPQHLSGSPTHAAGAGIRCVRARLQRGIGPRGLVKPAARPSAGGARSEGSVGTYILCMH